MESIFVHSRGVLVLLIALICAPNVSAQSFADYWGHFVQFEGLKLTRYYHRGIPHIGIGHVQLRGDYRRSISLTEVRELFEQDLNRAIKIAQKHVPSFHEQPEQVRLVLVDLAFNVGEGGFRDFVRFRRAIENRGYFLAAKELMESKRSQQVGKARINWAIKCLTSEAVRIK